MMGDYLDEWVDEEEQEEEPTAMVEEEEVTVNKREKDNKKKKKKTSDVIFYSFKFSFLILCTLRSSPFPISEFCRGFGFGIC